MRHNHGDVDAASQLGWKIVHFSDAESLAGSLSEHGLLDQRVVIGRDLPTLT
jgi:hypothetical protein